MTNPQVPIAVWCWPGPHSAAEMTEINPGENVLQIFLDPMNVVVSVPPFQQGPKVMARLCRELSVAAYRMAAVLDPAGEAERPAKGAHRSTDSSAGDRSW